MVAALLAVAALWVSAQSAPEGVWADPATGLMWASPVATGQVMPEKTFDGYIAEVKKRKAEAALGIAKDHAGRP